MNKRFAIIGVVAVIVIGFGVAAYAVHDNSNARSENQASSSSPQKDNLPTNTSPSPEAKPIVISGKIGCLTPKDTTGVVDLSCAIGLEAADGKSYALSAQDPTLTGSVPTGQQVRVTGSFTEKTSQYKSVGIIKVESLERQ